MLPKVWPFFTQTFWSNFNFCRTCFLKKLQNTCLLPSKADMLQYHYDSRCPTRKRHCMMWLLLHVSHTNFGAVLGTYWCLRPEHRKAQLIKQACFRIKSFWPCLWCSSSLPQLAFAFRKNSEYVVLTNLNIGTLLLNFKKIKK